MGRVGQANNRFNSRSTIPNSRGCRNQSIYIYKYIYIYFWSGRMQVSQSKVLRFMHIIRMSRDWRRMMKSK